MRMVASAKLHHTQGMTEAFLRYKDELEKIVKTLSHNGEGDHLDGSLNDGGDVRQDKEGLKSILFIPVSSNLFQFMGNLLADG